MNQPDLQPRLIGELVELRPLQAEDWEALFAAAADPLIWEQHPAHDRHQENVFREFFREALASGGALVALDRQTKNIIGSSRYSWLACEPGEIQIGWTFLVRSHWGGKYNGEMKRLMLDHAFTFADGVIFQIGAKNLRSRKAVEKIGGILTDRRDQQVINGKPVERVIYKISK